MKAPGRYAKRCQCLFGCRAWLPEEPQEQEYDVSSDGPYPVLIHVPVCDQCYQEVTAIADPW